MTTTTPPSTIIVNHHGTYNLLSIELRTIHHCCLHHLVIIGDAILYLHLHLRWLPAMGCLRWVACD
jgi:hypothetical protein